ncbi:unnamed protein product, partial [Brassica oleracea var. botrytis]
PSAPELGHVCGRPLAKPLVTKAEGQPFRFTNDLDIHEHEDVVYFTDTSTRFQRRQFLAAVLNLPGLPDNIRRNSNGEFWVALHSKKGLFAKLSLTQTWFRDLVLRLPISGQRLHSLFTGGRPHATALKL